MMGSTREQIRCIDHTIDLRPGGVCVVALTGLLTDAAIQECKACVVRAINGERVAAFLVDFRRCAVALGGDELDRTLVGEEPGAVITLPAALVVQPMLVDLFRSHAMRMALHGHFRRVFVDPAHALAWAHEMAQRQG